jgi:hypothetical protein
MSSSAQEADGRCDVPVASSVWFNTARFQQELTTKHLGRCFVYRRLTTSTMDLAAREFREGAPHGTVVLAEEQSNPKARVEQRTWSSAPKGNIYMTYLVRSERFLNAQHLAALALVQACHVTRIATRARVKWPNTHRGNESPVCGGILTPPGGVREAVGLSPKIYLFSAPYQRYLRAQKASTWRMVLSATVFLLLKR